MEVFHLQNKKAERVNMNPFLLEKDIQYIVENNTNTFFELDFICSEFAIGNYRIDTLCYDSENKCFVIIEYKKGSSYSVIDQGYTYLQVLLNNKSDFLLRLSQHFNKVLQLDDIDWSQSKIIFISQSFNSFQKDSVNFKNLPFELWEMTKYSDNIIILLKHQIISKESIEGLTSSKKQSTINAVNKEVMVVDEEYHTSKSNKKLLEIWEELKERFNELDNVELSFKKLYIVLVLNKRSIAYFYFRKSEIRIDISRGNLNSDGSTSKNYFHLDDPKGISKEFSWVIGPISRGTGYKIQVAESTDIDYLMFLLKQKYKNLLSK